MQLPPNVRLRGAWNLEGPSVSPGEAHHVFAGVSWHGAEGTISEVGTGLVGPWSKAVSPGQGVCWPLTSPCSSVYLAISFPSFLLSFLFWEMGTVEPRTLGRRKKTLQRPRQLSLLFLYAITCPLRPPRALCLGGLLRQSDGQKCNLGRVVAGMRGGQWARPRAPPPPAPVCTCALSPAHSLTRAHSFLGQSLRTRNHTPCSLLSPGSCL